MSSSVEVEATVFPTEDVARVLRALKNILPESEVQEAERVGLLKLVARSSDIVSLNRFRDMLAKQRIRLAAKAALLGGISSEGVRIELNKQAAYANRVSFADPDDSPLGTITLRIRSPNPEQVIEWLTGERQEIRP